MAWGRHRWDPETYFQATGSATLIEGFDSASYGRYLHWCFVPDHKHGSGPGDHWHGGKGARPSTPLGRLVNRSSPGRTASRSSDEERKDAKRSKRKAIK